LLEEGGFSVHVVPSNALELEDSGMQPGELAVENARRKWMTVAPQHGGQVVVAADTVVWLGGKFYGKPRDMRDAKRMLGELSGRTHIVATGVAVGLGGNEPEVFFEETRVAFRELDSDEIHAYLGSIHPLDKAGGYAAQDGGERIIASIKGSMSNVVGLPMEALGTALAKFFPGA
jgi:septum formation protein